MIEESTEGYSPDAAFVAGLTGDGEMLGEIPLRKFTLERSTAARTMGCMAPRQFTKDAIETLNAVGNYPMLHHDMVCILWLCSLSDEPETAEQYRDKTFFTPSRVFGNPDAARRAAFAWAETSGLADEGLPPWREAWRVFLKIVFAVDASIFQVRDDQAGRPPPIPPPKTKPGPPNSRKPSRARRKNPGTRQNTSGAT